MASGAASLGAAFLNKRSLHLLGELRRFMRTSLGFGDFVFILPDGTEVGRSATSPECPTGYATFPRSRYVYHASRNHFSNWCMARTEFALAARIRPLRVSEFRSTEDLRQYLIDAFSQLWTDTRRGVVAEFSRSNFDETSGFTRIGTGSMGARAAAWVHQLTHLAGTRPSGSRGGPRLRAAGGCDRQPDVFDTFLAENQLSPLALSDAADEEIARAFLAGRLSDLVVGTSAP